MWPRMLNFMILVVSNLTLYINITPCTSNMDPIRASRQRNPLHSKDWHLHRGPTHSLFVVQHLIIPNHNLTRQVHYLGMPFKYDSSYRSVPMYRLTISTIYRTVLMYQHNARWGIPINRYVPVSVLYQTGTYCSYRVVHSNTMNPAFKYMIDSPYFIWRFSLLICY